MIILMYKWRKKTRFLTSLVHAVVLALVRQVQREEVNDGDRGHGARANGLQRAGVLRDRGVVFVVDLLAVDRDRRHVELRRRQRRPDRCNDLPR